VLYAIAILLAGVLLHATCMPIWLYYGLEWYLSTYVKLRFILRLLLTLNVTIDYLSYVICYCIAIYDVCEWYRKLGQLSVQWRVAKLSGWRENAYAKVIMDDAENSFGDYIYEHIQIFRSYN